MEMLDLHKFTPVPLAHLQAWVIWQFPRVAEGGWHCGAIRSTVAGSLWWPACIDSVGQVVYVYTAVDNPLPTPEEAADLLAKIFPH